MEQGESIAPLAVTKLLEKPLCVHSLAMGLGRAYLLEHPAGLFLVDSGSVGNERQVLRRMRALRRDDLRLIFITHAHLDHYGSAAALRRQTGALLAVHNADAEAMAAGQSPLGRARGRGRVVAWLFPLLQGWFRPESAAADLLLEDGDDLSAYGLEGIVVHTPGHTPGSSCLLLAEGLAFAGDLISTTGRPHAQRFYAVDWSLIPGSLSRLQALRPQVVYPGHGRHPLHGKAIQLLH